MKISFILFVLALMGKHDLDIYFSKIVSENIEGNKEFSHLDDLWLRICEQYFIQNESRAQTLKDNLCQEKNVILFLSKKVSSIDTEIEFKVFIELLDSLGDNSMEFYEMALQNTRENVRLTSLKLLLNAKHTPTNDVISLLVNMLDEEEYYQDILKILKKFNSTKAVSIVYEKIQTPKNSSRILVASCYYLSEVQDKKSIPVFMNLLEDNRFEVREAAAQALIRYGPIVEHYVVKLLESGTKYSRWGAVKILGQLGSNRDLLIPLLLHEDRAMKAHVIRTLKALGMPHKELERVVGNSDDPWIKGALAAAPLKVHQYDDTD